MELLILLVLVLVVLGVGFGAWRVLGRRRAGGSGGAGVKRKRVVPVNEYDPYSFSVGDRIRFLQAPGRVIGIVEYTDDVVYTWTALHLELPTERLWVTVVDEAHGVELVRWKPLSGLPGDTEATSVEFDGVTYLYQEGGEGRYTSQGTTDLPRKGEMSFRDFYAGNKRLSMESYDGGPWAAMVGEVLPIGDLRHDV